MTYREAMRIASLRLGWNTAIFEDAVDYSDRAFGAIGDKEVVLKPGQTIDQFIDAMEEQGRMIRDMPLPEVIALHESLKRKSQSRIQRLN